MQRRRRRRGDEALKAYEDGLERRSGRVPLQHILGTQEFMGMEFLSMPMC